MHAHALKLVYAYSEDLHVAAAYVANVTDIKHKG
jgi:hypothetical protein